MKILMLSTDERIFSPQSAVRERMRDYGTVVDELHIIIPITGKKIYGNERISSNVLVYPAYSKSKLGARLSVFKVARAISADLVTTQDPFETGLVGYLIARRLRVPLELQIHTDFLSPFFVRESFLNKIRVHIAHFLLPKAQGIRVVSERIGKSLFNKYGELKAKQIVLPIFVDIEKISKSEQSFDLRKKYPQFDSIILMISRLSREKNINFAIKIFGEIIKDYPKIGLIIVGSGSEGMKLKEQVSSSSLVGGVIFESWQDNISSYYKSADIFLNTSNYEGFGLTLMEASVFGCPIISTDVGVIGEILRPGKDALVCKVGDAQCLKEKIVRLLSSPPIREELANSARTQVEAVNKTKSYYVKKIGEFWEKIYKPKN